MIYLELWNPSTVVEPLFVETDLESRYYPNGFKFYHLTYDTSCLTEPSILNFPHLHSSTRITFRGSSNLSHPTSFYHHSLIMSIRDCDAYAIAIAMVSTLLNHPRRYSASISNRATLFKLSLAPEYHDWIPKDIILNRGTETIFGVVRVEHK
ncbi:hypothetical protein BC829DRAFT_61211 [Chytridium lagenaria]|nr:hypothetical protein BC829DRAFT_61211 [Chytridium lagenaria]